jgi:hypothetical protein
LIMSINPSLIDETCHNQQSSLDIGLATIDSRSKNLRNDRPSN